MSSEYAAQLREMLRIHAEQTDSVPVPVYPPPCHDLPDFMIQRQERNAFVSESEAWYPPIPIVQAFIDECCNRVGSMTHLEVDRIWINWRKKRNVKSHIINIRQLFKYLSLMGYDTKIKNKIYVVNGLSLRPEIVAKFDTKQQYGLDREPPAQAGKSA